MATKRQRVFKGGTEYEVTGPGGKTRRFESVCKYINSQ